MESPIKSSQSGKKFVYECSVCNAGFSDLEELMMHSEDHENESLGSSTLVSDKFGSGLNNIVFSCVECTGKFESYRELQLHAEVHSKIVNCKVENDECGSVSGIVKASPTSIMGVKKMRMVRNSDVLERLKQRVLPMSPSKIDEDEEVPEHFDPVEISLKSLECVYCGKKFMRRDNIRKHIRTHTGEKPYSCSYCDKRFACASSRKKHVRTHTGEKPYICKICGTCFSQNASLKQHAFRQHGTTQPALYSGRSSEGPSPKRSTAGNGRSRTTRSSSRIAKKHCVPCDKGFNTQADYDMHLQTYHNDPDSDGDNQDAVEEKKTLAPTLPEKSYYIKFGNRKQCTTCGQTFSCNSSLKRHYRVHSGERPFKCPVCPNSFTQGSTLKKHIQRLHSVVWAEMERTAPFDSKNFKDDREQEAQEKEVEEEEEEDEDYYGTVIEVNDELALPAVEDPTDLRCRFCKVQFANMRYLAAHERTHTTRKLHSCKFCGRCFGYKSHLKRHMLIHTGEKPHRCPICKLTFRQKVSVNSHIRKHHKGSMLNRYSRTSVNPSFFKQPAITGFNQHDSKPYKCDICFKAFQHYSSLTRHRLYHNFGKALKCAKCGQQFTKQSNLREHMKKHATPVKKPTVPSPHECTVCGDKFRYAIQLNKHMVVHEDDVKSTVDDADVGGDLTDFFIEDTLDDDPVSDDSDEDLMSEKREGVLVPLDPEFLEESGTKDSAGDVDEVEIPEIPNPAEIQALLSSIGPNKVDVNAGEEKYPIDNIAADVDTDPTYFPCKRAKSKKRSNRIVSTGSETLLKLSMSMNSGKCAYCGKMFSSRSDMRRHLRTHTGEKPFKCNDCGGRFTQKKSLVEHQRTHTGERPHKCGVCKMQFRYRSHLSRHIKIANHFADDTELPLDPPTSSMYSCVACNEEYDNLDELRQHLEGVHGIGEDDNIADESDRKENGAGELVNFVPIKLEPLEEYDVGNAFNNLTDDDLYTCDLCKERFTDYEPWIKHMDSHSPSEFA